MCEMPRTMTPKSETQTPPALSAADACSDLESGVPPIVSLPSTDDETSVIGIENEETSVVPDNDGDHAQIDSPSTADDSFLATLQSGFDRDMDDLNSSGEGQLSPTRSVTPRTAGLSGALKQVREETSEHGSAEPTSMTRPEHPSHVHVTFVEEDAIQKRSVQKNGSVKDSASSLHPSLSHEEKLKKRKSWLPFDVDKNALHFGVRISAVLTVSSLFVLAQPPDTQAYPQGLWVFISALIVSWFPSLDAAEVVEKTFQRVLGTIIGACLGIGVGFISITLPDFTSQAIFIGACITIISFLYAFVTIQFKTSIFGKYMYASLLCLLTFGIAVLPFYTHDHPKWKNGVFRVINVIVGCIIGGVGALLLWPRSTKGMLRDKIQAQVQLAGESSAAVLEYAADTFRRSYSDRRSVVIPASYLSMRRFVNSGNYPNSDGDDQLNFEVHKTYNKALEEWRGVNAVFPLAKWDPFLRLCGNHEQDSKYREDVALTLARALRIQTTVVILDGLVRNDPSSHFTSKQLELIMHIGTLIKTMLDLVSNEDQREAASEALLDKVDDVRGLVVQQASEVLETARTHRRLFSGSAGKEDYKIRLGQLDTNMPLCIRSDDKVALLFVQLVEHLIIRSLRLYFIWRQIES